MLTQGVRQRESFGFFKDFHAAAHLAEQRGSATDAEHYYRPRLQSVCVVCVSFAPYSLLGTEKFDGTVVGISLVSALLLTQGEKGAARAVCRSGCVALRGGEERGEGGRLRSCAVAALREYTSLSDGLV